MSREREMGGGDGMVSTRRRRSCSFLNPHSGNVVRHRPAYLGEKASHLQAADRWRTGIRNSSAVWAPRLDTHQP